MTVFLGIIFVAFLILWGIAWRNQTRLAFGIFIGIGAGWLIASLIGPIDMEHIPLWLPPLPFALVALTLFCFGVAAWVSGTKSSD
jgi:hypothetical protein